MSVLNMRAGHCRSALSGTWRPMQTFGGGHQCAQVWSD